MKKYLNIIYPFDPLAAPCGAACTDSPWRSSGASATCWHLSAKDLKRHERCLGFRVQGVGFRVLAAGFGFRALGFQIDATPACFIHSCLARESFKIKPMRKRTTSSLPELAEV